MTTVTVEIDKEQDLPALEAVLSKMGLKFHVEDEENEWGDLSEYEIESIKAGLADIEAGRVYTHEEVMARMDRRLKEWRAKNG
jgi:predicted transcriptional regulator